MGVWDSIIKKILKCRYHLVSLKDFKSSFQKELNICGSSLDSNILDYIDKLDLSKINNIKVFTSYSNINKDFIDSWSGLSKYLSEMSIDLIIGVPTDKIPNDIYFYDSGKCYLFPKLFFDKKEPHAYEIKKNVTHQHLLNLSKNFEDITHLKGNQVYHQKFNKLFNVEKRKLSEKDKEEILNAITSWETSGYDDLEPILRFFEEKIRRFIQLRLEKVNPKNWFTVNVLTCFKLPEIVTGIMSRFEKNKEAHNVTNIDDHTFPVEYLVSENYEVIIHNKNNKAYFSDYKDSKYKKYHLYLNDIVNARNPALHKRTAEPDVDYHTDTISKILMYVEWLEKIEPSLK